LVQPLKVANAFFKFQSHRHRLHNVRGFGSCCFVSDSSLD